ncbi:MAG: hypothetical protein ACK5L5_11860, partial [Bacteroidales bacterium]
STETSSRWENASNRCCRHKTVVATGSVRELLERTMGKKKNSQQIICLLRMVCYFCGVII